MKMHHLLCIIKYNGIYNIYIYIYVPLLREPLGLDYALGEVVLCGGIYIFKEKMESP